MKSPRGHPVALAWSLVATAATGADTLADCRAIADDAARLACYDALAGSAAPLAAAPAPAAAATTPSAEEMFGRDTESLRRATGVELDEITGTVAAVQTAYGGKIVLQLDNGQVWAQVDTTPIDLRTGEAIRIRRAALGSYLLSEVGHNRSIRVRRSD